jgi:hypothetical protein
MTRPSKKEHERRLARRFLEGLDHTSLDDDEKPDFRVRRVAGDFALEVREYHSQTAEGDTGKSRLRAEVFWWRHVGPTVDSERQTRPDLKNVQAHFRFKDTHLPDKSEGPAVARALVGAIAAAVADPRFTGSEAAVEFVPRAQLPPFGSFEDGTVFLPEEDWPDIAERLASLEVSRYPLEWPSWDCQNATTAWVGPEVGEFKRILEEKAEAAKGYTLGGLPLWLLIVCDAVECGGDSHGDLSSHIFPRNEVEADRIADVLRQTGFDFQTGPFTEVWLFSDFTRERRRLHPPGGPSF